MRYQLKQIIYSSINLSPDDLMSMSEAAALLGLTLSGLRSKLDRGELTEVRDTEATHGRRHQRLLLRREVEDEVLVKQASA